MMEFIELNVNIDMMMTNDMKRMGVNESIMRWFKRIQMFMP